MSGNLKYEAIKASGRLPSPKGTALQVIRLTQKEDVSSQEIVQTIKADPGLSGRVIKIANALVAYQSRPIASVADAVTVLGLNSVRQLVLGVSLLEGSLDGTCRGFDYPGFWARSLLTAIAAQNLMLRGNLGSPEEIFILGLMAQIGCLALATTHPQEYASILERAAAGSSSLVELERAELGLDHNQLSKELIADWGMPLIFQKLVLYHEEPDQAGFVDGSRDWRLLHVLHVANYLSMLCFAPEQSRRKMAPRLMLLATRLGVEANELTELGDKVVKEWHDWGRLFDMPTEVVPPFAQLLEAVPLAPEMVDVEALHDGAAAQYKLRILLVDDDRAILMMLQTLLTQAGHAVTTARNGAEALRQVAVSMPQLIITDWVMPEMDGIEFCKALRQNPQWRNIYVFIVTAQESIDRLVEAFHAGANDYLTKPINFKVLGARLCAAQRVVQLQDELESDRQQLRRFADELAASNQRLQQMALTDVLTGLYNRRYANEYLERQWALAGRNNQSLSCMMVDVDRFKQINDTYGHKMGDDVLKQVADVLRKSMRKQDVVCRLGGEEFLLVCPDTKTEQAYPYAERLRQNIAASNIHTTARDFHLTVSIGVASKDPALQNVEALLQLADKRLYAAKQAGRNCTVAS
ncbi:MAG: diguanylate cyclase [Nitrosomonadales bacterium]|nr:diguanylate cyclase [Nitrosomonadales bacterium]